MKKFKNYLSILISSVAVFNLQTAWAGKTEYDIPCEEQIFNDPSYNRKTVHISRYVPDSDVKEDAPSVLFFHGGPGLKNEGQFDKFIEQFTNNGFKVYVLEIIGSSYYQAGGMDANEYKKNYCTDIQAVVNHITEDSLGKKYAISHSFGCHQLFHFMSHRESKFTFDAVSAIAGPWDVGANRLNIIAPDWKNNYTDFHKNRFQQVSRNYVGVYAKLENEEKAMEKDYNPVVNGDLNKNFSVLHHMEKRSEISPVLFMHAKDDQQVCFSLSLNMLEVLRKNGNNVSGYFLSTGDHGFIKNSTPDLPMTELTEIREKAVENILSFFKSPNQSIYFDNQSIEFGNISVDRDARQEHEEFLKIYGVSKEK